ncbi:MAG: hypothetical protein FD124_2085 [Alphaproteobacteria bacterium]|nr:MAG: hypothetical protein FD160_3535 [Caulobacteraceae bacterium]TPW05594.1 MAG: hypothetical protein FD124_2085 [Alphaproteobacteria bacterium]
MRLVVVACAVLALAGCSPAGEKAGGEKTGGPAAVSDSAGMPKPKVGKWKMTMDIAGMPTKQSVAICLTQAMIDDMKGYAQSSGAANCTTNDTTREGQAIITRAVCEAAGGNGGATNTIVTRAVGDFNSRYTVETSITSDPPSPTGPMTSSTLAEYMGPC